MIDLPPRAPPAYERTIEQKLVQCGLAAGHFTVRYEDELQSVGVVIERGAGASINNLDCIRAAAGTEIVSFRDAQLQAAYDQKSFEAIRPKMLADAQKALAERGLLNGFPERANFASDKLFAEALERHCGVKPGSFFVQSQSGLTIRPENKPFSEQADRLSCVMNALMYVSARGEPFKVGFTGNGAAPRKR